ncbi:DUF1579 domain-containing protein [Candidatus Poribacteria bacterium]|nr:DUF1579 domain-containing protein [Candidatus Poribacteria bacterium]
MVGYQLPKPLPEHERLTRKAGVWDVECTLFTGPGQPPFNYTAVDRAEAVGPFWLIGNFESDAGGFKISGKATTGFDPSLGRYVSTWVDSTTTSLFSFEGSFDESTGVLALEGRGSGPFGNNTPLRCEETEQDSNHRTFRMFLVQPDGAKVMLFEYRYTRRE